MIIGISGKLGSGKDTVGSIIQYLTSVNTHIPYNEWLKDKNYQYPGFSSWEIKKFAGKLKQIVSLLTGIPVEDLEKQEVKDRVLGEEWQELHTTPTHENTHYTERTVRWLLQKVGTDAMRDIIHTNIWVNALFADYNCQCNNCRPEECNKLPNWIITDVRFPNEADAILKRGGILIRVNRLFNKVNQDEHISETALDNYPNFTEVIENNGTIEELVPKIKVVLQKHKLTQN